MTVQKISTNKPVLILLYGLPGAGKTYFARNLSANFEAAVIHSDRIRNELFEEPRYDEQEDDIVTHLMNYMSEEFLGAGVNVIYDTNAMRKSQRHGLRELARKKQAKTLVVWFQVDADTAYNRLRNRDRRTADDKYAIDYSQTEFRKYASKMQQPEMTEDYVVVSGKHNYTGQKNAFFKKLIEMGLATNDRAQSQVAKPGLINLVPKSHGRVDMTRRNINVR
jgi:hypothetical protein